MAKEISVSVHEDSGLAAKKQTLVHVIIYTISRLNTVDWEIFVVKNFSSITSTTKIKQAKYFIRRITYANFRRVVIATKINHAKI